MYLHTPPSFFISFATNHPVLSQQRKSILSDREAKEIFDEKEKREREEKETAVKACSLETRLTLFDGSRGFSLRDSSLCVPYLSRFPYFPDMQASSSFSPGQALKVSQTEEKARKPSRSNILQAPCSDVIVDDDKNANC